MRHAPDEPVPKQWRPRRPPPGTRWRIAKSIPLSESRGEPVWYAGPIGIGLYAEMKTRRRWIFFPSWADARDAVFGKAPQ